MQKSNDNDDSVESFVLLSHDLLSCDVERSFSEYKRQTRKSFLCVCLKTYFHARILHTTHLLIEIRVFLTSNIQIFRRRVLILFHRVFNENNLRFL